MALISFLFVDRLCFVGGWLLIRFGFGNCWLLILRMQGVHSDDNPPGWAFRLIGFCHCVPWLNSLLIFGSVMALIGFLFVDQLC
jgi:hypothetical protein